MKPIRQFLGWDQPLLDLVCDRLLSEAGRRIDFSTWSLITGTAQAGRLLRRELAARAEGRGGALVPPRILTPQQFLRSQAARAQLIDPVGRVGIWSELLASAPARDLEAILPRLPQTRDSVWAIPLARRILQLRAQLSEGGWDFDQLSGHEAVAEERERWRALAGLEARYRERLNRCGLTDPEDAIRGWAERPPPLEGVERFTVVAAPDPMPVAVAGWERILAPEHAEVWVHAPETEADAFDTWGRPTEAILAREIPIVSARTRIHLAENPEEQAAAAAEWVLRHRDPSGTLAVGGADAEVLSALGSDLEERGIATFDPGGRPARDCELVAFLEILLELDGSRRIPAFCDLVRLPAVLASLCTLCGVEEEASMLAAIDEFLRRRLPVGFDEALALAGREREPAGGREDCVHSVLDTVDSWMARLDGIGEAERLNTLLTEVFGPRVYREDGDALFLTAAQALEDLLAAHQGGAFAGSWSLRELLQICVGEIAETPVSSERSADAVALTGWLELPWDARPHLLLTGCNEGRLPASVRADPFLPDSVRRQLGLADSASRFRRDAGMMRALLAMREESGRVDCFVGRFSGAGEALTPSRLLLHCDRNALPDRVRHLFSDPPERGAHAPWTRSWRLNPGAAEADVVQGLGDTAPVTALRDYLECPFRFALRHILKMEGFDAEQQEMDAGEFGGCIHAALEAILRDPEWNDCCDAVRLQERLGAAADQFLSRRYGSAPPLPVLVQRESARERLAAAAEHIATWREEGWRPLHVEWTFTLEGAQLGAPLGLRGKIDLVEVREHDGALRLVDFKTADHAITPEAAHLRRPRKGAEQAVSVPAAAGVDDTGKRVEWIDLQLPVYARAIGSAPGIPISQFEMGYFNLPKAVRDTGWRPWVQWNDALEDGAVACVQEVLAAIAARRYWPPAARVRFDEFGKWFPPQPGESIVVPGTWEGAHK